MALLAVRRGLPDAAQAVAEARAQAAAIDELQWVVPAALAQAELTSLAGSLAEERAALQALFDRVQPTGVTWAIGEVGRWLGRAGGAVDPSLLASPFCLEVAGRWQEAASEWAVRGCPYEQAAALAASTEPDELMSALAIFGKLRARPAATLVRDKLRSMGVRRLPRAPRTGAPGHPAGLTSRQEDVLKLIVDGLTNAEIADEFVVSVRTVDHHVAAILARLGVANRRQAAERARHLGLVVAS
jgi:DNA-binding CsgD family transcriptional regulator